eukprot:9493632-Pyramimonas_sp.AAC.1
MTVSAVCRTSMYEAASLAPVAGRMVPSLACFRNSWTEVVNEFRVAASRSLPNSAPTASKTNCTCRK